jgi:hypothetical protein
MPRDCSEKKKYSLRTSTELIRRAINAPENMALVRKLTHNLLQQETTLKRGVKTKRLKAGWDRSYLLKILNVKPSNS